MLPLSPKNAALERVLERVAGGDPPEAIVALLLQHASLGDAALDPTVLRAARTLVTLARDRGDGRAALRALGASARRPATRLALVAAVAEGLDREPASPIGQIAVLAAIEALVGAPEPLGPSQAPMLLSELLSRVCERWLLSLLGRHAGDDFRTRLSAHVRVASRHCVSPEERDDDEPLELLLPRALASFERALGRPHPQGGAA
jgi:hypothetical protein